MVDQHLSSPPAPHLARPGIFFRNSSCLKLGFPVEELELLSSVLIAFVHISVPPLVALSILNSKHHLTSLSPKGLSFSWRIEGGGKEGRGEGRKQSGDMGFTQSLMRRQCWIAIGGGLFYVCLYKLIKHNTQSSHFTFSLYKRVLKR